MIKRPIKFLIAALILLIVSLIIAPPIIKWYVEEHSIEWTGRQIRIEHLGINYFTGGITLEGINVLEADGKATFFSCRQLFLNTEPWRAITGAYEVLEITLDLPKLNIIQTGDHFNFDDLLARFAITDSTTITKDESTAARYWIRNISIKQGDVAYVNNGLSNTINLVNLNAALPLLSWDDPMQRYAVDFELGQGGSIKSNFDLNTASLEYVLRYKMDALNLDVLYPYLKDYIKVNEMKGAIHSALNIYGNLNEPQAIAAAGRASLVNLSITDPNNEPLIKVGSFDVDVDTLNVKSDLYNVRAISLTQPYLKFEMFENENNFSKLIDYSADADGSVDSSSVVLEDGNIFELLVGYVRELSENYAISNYRADSVVVRGGTLIFNDYTLNSKFNYQLENLVVKAERLNSANQRLTFLMSSILNNSGKMRGQLLVDPKRFSDMEILYTVDELKIMDFNPYSDYYVAHPFEDGICYYTTKSSIKNRILTSDNKLEIRKIVVGKKHKNKTAVNLPLRFAVALLRDVHGNINLDVPVTGNLDDPKYRIGPIIWQILKNLVLKAVAAPGKLLAKRSGVEEKYLEGFNWNILQTKLDDEQMKALDAAAKTLSVSPEMYLQLVKAYNIDRELDQMALEQSKKRFLFFSRKISSEDNVTPDEERLVKSVEVRDSLFNAYIDSELKTNGSPLSIFDKSKRLVGTEKLKKKLLDLFDSRSDEIRRYLSGKGIDSTRYKVIDPKQLKSASYEAPSRSEMKFVLGDDDPEESL